MSDRDPRLREPEVALHNLARPVLDPIRRIDPGILRPDLPDPVLQGGDRVRPANPLRDHRRGHPRKISQQLPHLKLDRVDKRPPRRPVIHRRPIRRQRRPHRIPRHPQQPGNLLDRDVLPPMQTTNLSPVLHCYHPPRVLRRGQDSNDATGSVFTRRRHRTPLIGLCTRRASKSNAICGFRTKTCPWATTSSPPHRCL